MLNSYFTDSCIQQKSENLVNDLNEETLSRKPESLERSSFTQSPREKIFRHKREKNESTSQGSEKFGEELKDAKVDDCILMREKLPLFCSISGGKPKDHPDQCLVNIYLNSEFLAQTKTITHCWLPIVSLKSEGKFNSNFKKNVDILKSRFPAWRKVRGDGNCYYRSVMASYLLKIFHPSSNLIHSEEFMSKLLKHKVCFPLENLYNTLSSLFFEFQKQRDSSAYLKIEKLLQDPQFDLCLIETSRVLSDIAIGSCSEIKDFLSDSEEIQLKSSLQTMGNEAEGVELFLLPTALGIIVEQVNFFEDILYSSFPKEDPTRLSVHIICKSRGHYDMLLSIKDMEIQQYSVKELIFYHN